VGTGNRADRVGDSEQDKAEGQGHAHDAIARAVLIDAECGTDSENCGADGQEYQEEGADEFANEALTE
jgi:hypothetical protein